MEQEKRNRADADKAKRKLEGEIRIAKEDLEEINKQRQDIEAALKRKETYIFEVSVRAEETQNLVAKIQRQIRDNDARLKELETDLELERQARVRSEHLKDELQYEIDDLQEQMDQNNNGISLQVRKGTKILLNRLNKFKV